MMNDTSKLMDGMHIAPETAQYKKGANALKLGASNERSKTISSVVLGLLTLLNPRHRPAATRP
jgi:hypothetical protein